MNSGVGKYGLVRKTGIAPGAGSLGVTPEAGPARRIVALLKTHDLHVHDIRLTRKKQIHGSKHEIQRLVSSK